MLALTGHKVAVQPKFEDDTYAGSTIIKPDSYKRRSTQGIVKYIGPEVKDYKHGDYVFYSAYAGTLWKWKGELLILFSHEDDLLFKIENIPYTGIKGVYLRERIDTEKNNLNLNLLLDEFLEQTHLADEDGTARRWIEYLTDKVDAYGAYFEAPYAHIIERIADTFQKEEWTNRSGVNDAPEMQNLELYKDHDRICEECGGKQKQMRGRSTTKIFLKCVQCGRIRDLKKIKSELK